MPSSSLRIDQEVIAELVEENSRILDLGCGDGLLLDYLISHKNARGFGVEISHKGVHTCISRGLPVCQGDIDHGLPDHQDNAFDYVILSQTLQATRKPLFVMEEILRVGKRVIVSFPNFGYWRIRFGLLGQGRMPQTRVLPHHWHDTPNIHMCTILDFQDMCVDLHATIVRQLPLASSGKLHGKDTLRRLFASRLPDRTANLLAPLAVFLLEKKKS